MFTYNEVIEKLNLSSWPETAKQNLLPVLPRLGKWSLSFVSQQISSTGSEFIADDVVKIISLQPKWYEDLQQSQTQEIVNISKEIIASNQEDFHKALLAVILDIRTNKAIAALVPTEVSKIFDQVEVLYLRNLPVSEVSSILRNRVNRISEIADLQMEIKRYCYYRDALTTEDEEISQFKRALQSNEQLIGTEPKSVKAWIDDFLQAASSSKDRSMYNVVQYVTNNPAVKSLSTAEKNALSDILKLYNWLFQPYTTAEEIESYEEIRMGNQAELTPTPTPVAPKPAPVMPKPATTLPEFDAARPTPSATLNENKYTPPAPTPSVQQQQPPKPRMNVPNQYTANPAKIHDLINQKPAPKMGVVMDPTNVRLEEEKRRMDRDRNDQKDIIAFKLEELRKRNKKEKEPNV